MKSLASQIGFILRASAIPVACSMIFGLIFYQSRVLNPHSHAFIFISDAAVGALFFYALRVVTLRDALGLLFVIYILYMGPLIHAFQYGATVPFTLFFVSAPLAVYVYHTLIVSRDRWNNVVSPLILAGLWGSTTILARLCVDLPRSAFWQRPFLDYPVLIFPNVLMATGVGFGVGVGFFLVEKEPLARMLKSSS